MQMDDDDNTESVVELLVGDEPKTPSKRTNSIRSSCLCTTSECSTTRCSCKKTNKICTIICRCKDWCCKNI
jgi:hypothetical protein